MPFVFASNGDGFVFHDKTNPAKLESEIALEDFPARVSFGTNSVPGRLPQAQLPSSSARTITRMAAANLPRYYQLQAINKTVAISKGEDRGCW